MFPVIFQIGPLKIYSYGLALALAVLVCTSLLSRDAEKSGIKRDVIMDLAFWCVVGGILGARLFYIFLNLSFFIENPLEIPQIQNGGLAWQGGFIGGFFSGFIFVYRRKLSFLQLLDLSAPYLALGQAIGRVGCFFNGCCVGQHASWGIYFPIHQGTFIPTQLFEFFALVILFFFLKFYQNKPHVLGQVFVVYLMLASIVRFIIQFYRDDYSVDIGILSVFQLMCISFFVLSGAGFAWLNQKSKK
jgi:phosphatidylglycerol:prolipoprotein diacylglycerol transferase